MQNKYKLNRESMIVAYKIVSSGAVLNHSGINLQSLYQEHPSKFREYLHELGADINKPMLMQNKKHRSEEDLKVYTGTRWVCEERQDEDWINSGYASQQAKDKFFKNRIVEDLYRSRSLTTDTQRVLEERDRFTEIDESVWE